MVQAMAEATEEAMAMGVAMATELGAMAEAMD